jgi:hypothetical protein
MRKKVSAAVSESYEKRRVPVRGEPSTTAADISRALDHELDWYFVYAEAALRRGCVEFLPSLRATLAARNLTEDALRLRAHALAETVQHCLVTLPDGHAAVLRTMYTPRRWPKNVRTEFQMLAPVAVRLSMTTDPWPAKGAHTGLEEAAATRLSARLLTKKLSTERIRAQAQRLFGDAIVAYTKVRVLEVPEVTRP